MPNEIDINDPRLQAEMVEADNEVDYFQIPAPPPDDRDYLVKVLLGDKGIVAKRQKKDGETAETASGPLFLNVALECRIIAPGEPFDDVPLYENATSIIMRNGTSLLHAILRALGYPAMGKMPLSGPGSLAEHAVGVFTSEPSCGISGLWEAQFEDTPGQYRTVKKGMKNFPMLDPQHPELGHDHYADVFDPITRRPTGEQARARFRITKYFPWQG